MKCVWCVLTDNDTNFQCNPSDLYISHAGLRFKNLFRCTIYGLLFLAITMQEYHFNSCITSSFTSRNLKQKPTRQADLRNNNWNSGLCMSQRKWFKLSQQNTFCYTVGDCLISDWGQTRASVDSICVVLFPFLDKRNSPYECQLTLRLRDWF